MHTQKKMDAIFSHFFCDQHVHVDKNMFFLYVQ